MRAIRCGTWIDYSFDGPEYWCGWSLAYYQWYSAFRFSDLRDYGLVPSEILKLKSSF